MINLIFIIIIIIIIYLCHFKSQVVLNLTFQTYFQMLLRYHNSIFLITLPIDLFINWIHINLSSFSLSSTNNLSWRKVKGNASCWTCVKFSMLIWGILYRDNTYMQRRTLLYIIGCNFHCKVPLLCDLYGTLL